MATVYIVRSTVDPAADAEFGRWQDREHVPGLLTVPGYVGAQRFICATDPTRYLNVWRLSSPEAFMSPAYERASFTPWFRTIRPSYTVHVDFSVEDDWGGPHGLAAWRAEVGGLAIDRSDTDAHSQPPESDPDLARLAAHPGVAHVICLNPMVESPALSPPSAPPARVVLEYLRRTAVAEELPPAPRGIERRLYRALGPYLAAPGAS